MKQKIMKIVKMFLWFFFFYTIVNILMPYGIGNYIKQNNIVINFNVVFYVMALSFIAICLYCIKKYPKSNKAVILNNHLLTFYLLFYSGILDWYHSDYTNYSLISWEPFHIIEYFLVFTYIIMIFYYNFKVEKKED